MSSSRVVQSIRKIRGVFEADAFRRLYVIAIVEGNDIASMEAVIDKIAENPLVIATDSRQLAGLNRAVLTWTIPSQYPIESVVHRMGETNGQTCALSIGPKCSNRGTMAS